jgi:uncharacterized protein YebE (UPF0316 family)
MEIIIQIVLFTVVGFVEMFVVTARTSLISKGKSTSASLVVFVEGMLYFVILSQIVSKLGNNWPVFIAYSAGGSLGTFVHLRHPFRG